MLRKPRLDLAEEDIRLSEREVVQQGDPSPRVVLYERIVGIGAFSVCLSLRRLCHRQYEQHADERRSKAASRALSKHMVRGACQIRCDAARCGDESVSRMRACAWICKSASS